MTSLRAEGLGKLYRMYDRPLDSLLEWATRRRRHREFWALRDVEFEVPEGGTFGIVGSNGAGKSTLLKILSGTIKPTTGTLVRNGRVSALLELGSGFHPDLTGRENLRLGCAVMGLSPDETTELEPEIVGFSELGDFIDRPVKTYSSGMYMRLSFSVATTVDPDILVIDEALSVGDQHFQKKCVDRMTAFRDAGKTLVFCSHQMYFVSRLCERSIWLRDGRIECMGATPDVVQAYQDYERRRDAASGRPAPSVSAAGGADEDAAGEAGDPVGADGAHSEGAGDVRIESPGKTTYLEEMELEGANGANVVTPGSTVAVRAMARVDPAVRDDVSLAISIRRSDGVRCCSMRSEPEGFVLRRAGERVGARVVFDELPLLSGEYEVDAFLLDRQGVHVYDVQRGALVFTVRHDSNEIGLVRIPHRWEDP